MRLMDHATETIVTFIMQQHDLNKAWHEFAWLEVNHVAQARLRDEALAMMAPQFHPAAAEMIGCPRTIQGIEVRYNAKIVDTEPRVRLVFNQGAAEKAGKA